VFKFQQNSSEIAITPTSLETTINTPSGATWVQL